LSVRLYHFTTLEGFRDVESSGAILATWGSQVLVRPAAWLTANPDPSRRGWKGNFDLRIRIEVAVEDAAPWRHVPHEWLRTDQPDLITSAMGWGADPRDWYIVCRDIGSDELREVTDLGEGNGKADGPPALPAEVQRMRDAFNKWDPQAPSTG